MPTAWVLRRLAGGLLALALAMSPAGAADDATEFRLKAAFVYNFMVYTEWPAETPAVLTLCIVGRDPFGNEIDVLQGKAVAARSIGPVRRTGVDGVRHCQAVFVSASSIDQLPRVLDALQGRPTLTLADSPGAAQRGVALNMALDGTRVTFQANLGAAKAAGLGLSSRLLRLATEVIQ